MMASHQHIRGMGAISAPCRPQSLRPISAYSRAPHLTHSLTANYAPYRLILRCLVLEGGALVERTAGTRNAPRKRHLPPLVIRGERNSQRPISEQGKDKGLRGSSHLHDFKIVRTLYVQKVN
jgi:hypothetical protein